MANANQQVSIIAPPSMPLPPAPVMKEFGLDESKWRVLVDQLFPAAKDAASVIMALSYCKARKLDVFKKPVHIVPMYSSALKRMVETCWPSIAEIRTTATRTGEYAGIDEVKFGPMIDGEFTGPVEQWENRQKVTKTITKKVRYPEWASVVVWRWVKGQKAAFNTKIYWTETYACLGKSRIPNDMWEKRPIGQFDKCLEAAALRKAFPEEVGSMYAAEEMEGRVIDHDDRADNSRLKEAATNAPKPPSEDEEDASNIEDAVVEEIVETERSAPDPDEGEQVDNDGVVTTAAEREEVDEEAEWDAVERFFADLRDALGQAEDEASVEDTYSEADPEARFDGNDLHIKRAQSLKEMRLRSIAKMKGKK